jgi:DNA-binding NarL/FixJ family response regulator
MHSKETIEVLIVEDQAVVRSMIKAILEHDSEITVVGEAEDGQKAVSLAKKLRPEIVLMDIEMPRMNGIDATSELKRISPTTSVIMVTTYADDTEVLGAFSAGADGYCLKNESMDALPGVIKLVAKGAAWIDPWLSNRLHGIITQLPPSSARLGFTEDEMAMLALLVEGLDNRQIAERLKVDYGVVKNRLRHMLGKLSDCEQTRSAAADLRERLAKT